MNITFYTPLVGLGATPTAAIDVVLRLIRDRGGVKRERLERIFRVAWATCATPPLEDSFIRNWARFFATS